MFLRVVPLMLNRIAPFWVESLSVILLINSVICSTLLVFFGLEFDILMQLAFSISVLGITLFKSYFFSVKSKLEGSEGEKSNCALPDGKEVLKTYSYNLFAFTFAISKNVQARTFWLIRLWSFVYTIAISSIVLYTWDCTTYIRVAFALSFLIFALSWLGLKYFNKA